MNIIMRIMKKIDNKDYDYDDDDDEDPEGDVYSQRI